MRKRKLYLFQIVIVIRYSAICGRLPFPCLGNIPRDGCLRIHLAVGRYVNYYVLEICFGTQTLAELFVLVYGTNNEFLRKIFYRNKKYVRVPHLGSYGDDSG